jgi:Tol biopolymer transport system component
MGARHLRLTPVWSTLILVACATGQANYFGQNQVRYDTFDFKIIQTPHFDIYYYEEERAAVEQAGRMAERWYARLSSLLNHEFAERQPIVYYASHPHFRQTLTLGGAPGEGTGGATEVFKRRIVLPFAGPLKETDHVLGHEIVHAFQFDMTAKDRGPVTMSNFPRALGLPLWFIEGMAEYLSVGANDSHTAMWLRDAVANDKLPTMRQLNDPRFFPYRFGQAFWAYVAGRFGDDVVGRVLNAAARTGSAEAALQQVLRIPVDSINAEWREAVELAFPVPDSTVDSGEAGKPAPHQITFSEERFGLNLAPALSADGSQVAFFTVHDLLSLDMFLADANTGEIIERIAGGSKDSHFESLQFIRSSGSWSHSGRRLAFASISEAEPVITVLSLETGQRQEIPLRSLDEVFNPTWSPDGNRLAFSAMVGGFTDLFVYDLKVDSLVQLTDDPFADLHPAWAPDGQSIAFVTDRYTSDLRLLQFGDYRLALIDPVSTRIEPGPSFPNAKNVNPQWSPDGTNLYFLSNPNGVTNVYRTELASDALYQLTDLYTGVSGITALSPALSSASGTDKIAYTVYEDGGYNIYTMDSGELLQGTRVDRGTSNEY